jgi:hypothetical protein
MRGASLIAAAIVAVIPAAASGETVGRTAVVVNDVTGTLSGASRRLEMRDPVNQDEFIRTGVESASEIVFLDGSQMALGPTAQIVIDEMVYDPRASRARLGVDVAAGAFRFVSGGFASPSYRIRTPTATIGLRGTQIHCDVPVGTAGSEPPTTCRVIRGQIVMTNRITGETTIVNEGETKTILGGAGSGSSGDGTGGAGVPDLATQFAALDALLGGAPTAFTLAGRPLPGQTPITSTTTSLSSAETTTSAGIGFPIPTLLRSTIEPGGSGAASPTLR